MLLITRDKYLNDLIARMGNGMVKVITGPRRCGKTFLLFDLFEAHLRAQGVDNDHIIEIALDDMSYAEYRNPVQLFEYLKSRITSRTEQYYVLLDEVQYAISDEELRGEEPPRLYEVLNGLLHMRNVDVYVTGSNSKMLSTDVMTQFRGRGDEVRVRPLSFAEFMQVYDGDVQHGWAEYVVFGGMPLTLSMHTDEQKSRYLENLFTETYLKDIVARNKLRKSQELDDLTNVLASSIGALTNPNRIKATFDSVLHSKISTRTIVQYIDYLEDAFVIEEARRYDVKGRKYIGSPKKYYFEDIGLRNARLGFRQVEQTHIMENIVYNELRMRGYNVDVGIVEQRGTRNGESYRKYLEVDFVANLGSQRYYIQSAYQLPTEEKIAQEKASLLGVDDSFKKIVLVRDVVKPTRDDHGILTMSVYDFLLNPNSLEA
ncbi:ATPase (AAA superfamily)-like protein [Bifidobacterium saguini DSM 23967]|uniref:ATPase (AAA superfamily)-like protein n=2 Tax=Bifidobacterium saguini TaxID=762210 RepID=A0A087DED6_9BIFI|nr:ATP-binding protein [Bifidobacterium saguini]KFI93886.1 ATPase (AAA superfamily)-like protein [Bifidobacterium saguini DSM 23967]QTB90077.1 ATP-binding protein [Bifidobacterium saguini]